MSFYNEKVREYNNVLKVLSGTNIASEGRKKEHQKEMAEYRNNTQIDSTASNTVGADSIRPYTPSYGGVPDEPKQSKSPFVEWNIEKTQPNRNETNIVGQGLAPAVYGGGTNVGWGWNPYPATTNIDKPTANGYNGNAKWEMPNAKFTIPQSATLTPSRLPTRSIAKRLPPAIGDFTQGSHWWHETKKGHQNVGAIHESPVYDSEFKKKAENQWYNKIAHGSFKEDDWFNSMVKNQEKAQNWYTTTYGEKVGKKEYQNLHNRLINTPFDKIKEEEKQFTNYKASDFKVPELEPVKYSYSGISQNKSEAKKEPIDEYVKSLNMIQKETGGNIQKSYIIKNIDDIYEKSDYFTQKHLSELRQKALDFDDETFNRLIFLNASDGAKGFGHAGVLLLNEKNEGIVFSFYSVNNTLPETLYNQAEMRVGILNEKQVNSFLYGDGKLYNLITSRDSLQEEQYDRFVYREITAEQGKQMFAKGAEIFSLPGKYKLFGRQCDNIASEIVKSGGVDYFVNLMPNLSYQSLLSKNKWSIE